MTRHTRFKLTIAAGVFLAAVIVCCLILRLEMMGGSAIGAMMAVFTGYIWGRTRRGGGKE